MAPPRSLGDPSGFASESTVHARATVYPIRDCPVTRVAAEHGIRGLVPAGRVTRPPQVVADTTDTDGLRELGAHPVVRVDGATVCRLPTLERHPDDRSAPACGHDHCLAHGFGFLPLDPYHVRWDGDCAHCSFAALDSGTVRRTTRTLAEADFAVELDQVVGSDRAADTETGTDAAVYDLDQLTERQREVAARAVERGYFDPDGPAAKTVADELGVSKSTLSEHLRAVQRNLARQVFGGKSQGS